MKKRVIRVLLAKIGLDGHDRGVKIIAKALRDAGMEIIYTGIYQTIEQVINTAIQESVDVVGISSLASGHLVLLPKLVKSLKEKGGEDILVIVGGIIPKADIPFLKGVGIAEVFPAGATTSQVVEFIERSVSDQ